MLLYYCWLFCVSLFNNNKIFGCHQPLVEVNPENKTWVYWLKDVFPTFFFPSSHQTFRHCCFNHGLSRKNRTFSKTPTSLRKNASQKTQPWFFWRIFAWLQEHVPVPKKRHVTKLIIKSSLQLLFTGFFLLLKTLKLLWGAVGRQFCFLNLLLMLFYMSWSQWK